jgi:hypothetical protein
MFHTVIFSVPVPNYAGVKGMVYRKPVVNIAQPPNHP